MHADHEGRKLHQMSLALSVTGFYRVETATSQMVSLYIKVLKREEICWVLRLSFDELREVLADFDFNFLLLLLRSCLWRVIGCG